MAQQTLNHLIPAYQGQSHAANRNAKFAEKADAMGPAVAASLFRAAAASEAIHRDHHKQAIEALGGKVASCQLDQGVVAETAANLRAANKGESLRAGTDVSRIPPTGQNGCCRDRHPHLELRPRDRN